MASAISRIGTLRDGVILCVRLGFFDRQPVEASHVEDVRGRPAIASLSDIRAHPLLAIHPDFRG
jgi:hypothetical protein